jgi:hypothetical protein
VNALIGKGISELAERRSKIAGLATEKSLAYSNERKSIAGLARHGGIVDKPHLQKLAKMRLKDAQSLLGKRMSSTVPGSG